MIQKCCQPSKTFGNKKIFTWNILIFKNRFKKFAIENLLGNVATSFESIS